MFTRFRFAAILACMLISHAAYAVPVSDIMEIHVIPNVGSTPVTINLDNVYTNAIPVCTYNLPSNAADPSVVRINSIGSTSITIKLGLLEDAPGGFATPGNVHCVIVEEGLHDVNGTPIEARKVLSTETVGRFTSPSWSPVNNTSGWENNLEDITSLITHPFSNPVVLGQVITSNDPLASIYYANNCSADRRAIPFSATGQMCVGKHISKEVGTRVNETIGVIIAGTTTTTGASGSTGGFRAGTTPRTIAGVDNASPFSVSTVETYSVGILNQLGERGGDGAWAVLYGADPLANNQINMAIDESEINNNGRKHTTEQVNYLVVTVPTITLEKVVAGGGPKTAADFTLSFSGITNNSGVSGSTNVTSFPVQPGTYTLSESSLAQYTQTDLSCTGGGSVTGNELQLTAFDYAACTFTNTYDSGAAAGFDVSGKVFEDLDSTGTLTNSEDWASAVSVFVNIIDTLYPSVVVQSVQVNPGTGDYIFAAIPPGDYELVLTDSQVNELPVAPDEWIFIAPSTGTQAITVAAANIAGEDFGLFHAPILNLTKSTSTSTVVNTSAGTKADYQIKLTNAASLGGDAEGVQISDVLPAGFTYDLASAVITTAATGNCLVAASRVSVANPADGASGTITWGEWTVPAGCEVVIDFSANIPNTVADATYDNSVSVITTTSPATISDFDGTLSNNENVTVTSAVLSVAKDSLIKTAAAGGTSSYRVIVSNIGTATASAVEINDVLPTNFTYSTTTSITGTHTRTAINDPAAAATSPVWGTFDIPAAGSVILEFVADIGGATPDAFYQNSASATSNNAKAITDFDGDVPANNTDDVEVASTSPITDLSITKTDGLSSAIPGNTISYSIVVSNTGTDVVGAGVTDIFDPDIFDVANVTWNCAITSGSGICATPGPATGNINTTVDLVAGSVATFSVTAAPILSNATGTISNTAVVAPPSDTVDSDVSNNSAIDNDTVLVPTGDIVITKDDGISSVVAGTSTTYTITVQNNGPSDMSGATVTDTFDSADVNVTNVDWTCAVDGGSEGACGAVSGSADISTSLDLTAGSSVTITAIVPVLEAAVTPLINDATITTPGTFTNTNAVNNTATDSNTISTAQADLEITKITSNGTPASGENFTYTLTLLNNGASGATNVVVTDTFPTNSFNFVSAVAQQGAGDTRTFANNASSLSWTIPFLPSGNSATIVITANITVAGVQTNSAEVTSSDQDDPDSSPANGILSEDDMDSVDVNVGGTVVTADLQISKTDGSSTAVPGSPVTYSIVVSNDAGSPNDVVGATVEDLFDPAYFDVPNVSWTCAITTGTGVCGSPGPVSGDIVNTTTVDLTIGSAATFTVTAPVLANASGTLSNTATVTVPTGVTESDPGNNSAVDNNTALAPVADLSLTKTVDDPTPNIGDLVTFTIEVTSDGPSDAANVSVRDILPSGYTFNLAGTSATQGSYNNATGDWTIGTLSTSAPVQTLSLAATVNSTGNYVNNAQVWTSDAPDGDSTPANDVLTEDDSADASVTLTKSDLSVIETTNNQTPVPGANVTFTLTVSNAGPDFANAVIIEDRLPTGFTYVSSSVSTSNADETLTPCTHVNGVVTCDLNTVDPLVDDVIQVIASANASTEGTTQTNVVEIMSATEYDPDSVHGNNILAEDDQDSIDLIISSTAQADLSLTKSTNNTGPGVSQSFEYTVVLTNTGPSSASGVVIVDTLPAGLNFVSAVVTGGDTTESCNLAGQALTCGMGTVTVASPETVTITVTVQVGQEGLTLTNSVEVTEVDNSDPNSTKNNGVTTEDDYAEVDITVSIASSYIISGSVYEDANVNLSREGSEDWTTGTPVFVNLVNNSGAVIQSVQILTGNGDYSFAGVFDGIYTAVVTNSATNINPVVPSGWIFTEPDTGSIDFTVAGSDLDFQHFGLYNGSTLSGTVFKDNGASNGTFNGIANNGIRDGVESGLVNVSVFASDSATGTVTYSSTTTDINGNYTLYLPDSVGATNVVITQSNSAKYNSTGADVGNTSGTYAIANDATTFTNTPGTIYNSVDFGDVLDNRFTYDGYQTVVAGDTAMHPHVFTAGSDGSITLSNTAIATPANPGWSEAFYLDTACNGVMNAGDVAITAPIGVVAGEKVCIILEQTTSSGMPYGYVNVATVTASFAYANSSIVNNYLQTDTTVIGGDGDLGVDELVLVKSVDKTSAAPGELLVYTVNYTNNSVAPLSSLEINDSIPAFTTFVSASCGTLASGLSACNITDPGVGNIGPLAWTMTGAMLAGGKGSISFVVQIDP